MVYLMLVIGLLVGAAAGFAVGLLRSRGLADRQRSELEARAVAAETQAAQLKELLAQSQSAADGLRDQLDAERSARTQAITRLEEGVKSIDEQKRLLASDREQLSNVFKSLSADALRTNSEDFRKQAQVTLGAFLEQAKGDIGKREEAIKGLVSPLEKSLTRLDEQVRQIESERQKAYGGLRDYLTTVTTTQEKLQAETRKLVSALSEPRARGAWGELTLRRVVEVAGMSDHCDFSEQVNVDGDEGRLRPDMVIKLPGGRQIVVDAKAPMDAYLTALAAENEEDRKAAMEHHARQIRQHLQQLGNKRYWEALQPTPEMVVLFVPGESFFSAALDCDRTLIEDGATQRVVLASPTTLIALLRAVSYGWQQEAIAQNAQQISDLGKQLYERIATWAAHLVGAQKSLRQTVERFNDAMGSLERTVLPGARKFKELGIASTKELDAVDLIDQSPRALPAELLPASPEPPALPGQ
ncbi:MAG: DNA recombination protein RmuC [Phycisphaerae bacterium]|nr:DNA recombination protein RmuC [Phycisphaerae bacterium]